MYELWGLKKSVIVVIYLHSLTLPTPKVKSVKRMKHKCPLNCTSILFPSNLFNNVFFSLLDSTWRVQGDHRFTVSPGVVVLHLRIKSLEALNEARVSPVFQNSTNASTGVLKKAFWDSKLRLQLVNPNLLRAQMLPSEAGLYDSLRESAPLLACYMKLIHRWLL